MSISGFTDNKIMPILKKAEKGEPVTERYWGNNISTALTLLT
jgi:hypothetical protein